MDLFGGADDISSGSDGEDKPPTPGQPIVSKTYQCALGLYSRLSKAFLRLRQPRSYSKKRKLIIELCYENTMNDDFLER